MRVGLISDIHGNCLALDAALADLASLDADAVVCLGDAVQGGAQPADTVRRLRALGCAVVMGNADAFLLAEPGGAESPEQREVRAWTLAQLSEADLAFMRGFQPTVEVPLSGGRRLLCFHGSPASYDAILLPDTPAAEWRDRLGPQAAAVMAGGHTHTQQLRGVAGGLFVNPGSVGAVYDVRLPEERQRHSPWAEYAVLTCEGERLSLDFRRAPYRLDDLLEVVAGSGRPHADRVLAAYRRAGI